VSEWQEFLRARGARFEGETVADFGDPAAERRAAAAGDVLADRSHLGLVRVAGADAAALLQGQQTNDVREVTGEHSQLSGLCSNKGRLVATFRVVLREDAYLLVLPRDQVPSVVERLRRYVLRSKVTVTEATGQLPLLAFQGGVASVRATGLLSELPAASDAVRHAGGMTAVRLRGLAPRFLVIADPAEAPRLWSHLEPVARPVGRAAWDLTEIYAGVPTVYPATADAFVPQMVNFQAVGGVSFSKGCYTGQEVVARTQYLGKLKRHMYRAHVQADARPEPGTDLYSPADASGQSVGKVVEAEPAPDGGYALLAVIQNEAAQAPVYLGSADGPPLSLQDLPYAV
jgi:hypothetical protein